jgi:CBS domain-containing protein
MRAHQLMTRKVISVAPETTIVDAARLMLKNHVSGLPVVDDEGALVGIVSEGDFLRRSEIGTPRKRGRLLKFLFGWGIGADDYIHEHGRRVSEIMTPSPKTVGEQATLADVVALMERNNVKRVPVVRDGKLVGIVSRSNLLGAVAALARDIPEPAPDDEHIRKRIVDEIEKYDWCPIGLSVTVHGGVVHLHGVVTDDRSRQAAIVAAENVHGVARVRDHLQWKDLEAVYD